MPSPGFISKGKPTVLTRSVKVTLARPFKAGIGAPASLGRRVSDAGNTKLAVLIPSLRDALALKDSFQPGLERPG
jgi:hypothetical protein